MKKIIALVVGFAFAAGAAYAGCGKKVTSSGTLASYDKDAKSIVIKPADGKETKITLTPTTETKNKAGKMAQIGDLVGKSVSVVSEHGKADSVVEKG